MSAVHVCPLSCLENTLKVSDARWMISLSAPGKSSPQPAQITEGFLALEFNDISEEREGLIAPNENHIRMLYAFFDRWNGKGPLLIHCWMGISRSTAAALLASAYFDRAQDMEELAGRLREVSPSATPNKLMIAMGDKFLNLDGQLVAAVNKIGRGQDASQGLPFMLNTEI